MYLKKTVWFLLFALLALPGRVTGSRARIPVGPDISGVGVIQLPDNPGMEVKRVESGSPADKAGIKEGDVILEVNGKTVDDVGQFIHSMAEMPAGAKVNFFVRDAIARRGEAEYRRNA